MSIENFQEIEEYFKENHESDDVAKFVAQFRKELDAENVKNYLDSDAGRPLLQSLKDRAEQDAVKLYRERHLQAEVDAKLLELNPPKTEAEKRVMELEQKMRALEMDKMRESLKVSTIKKFSEKESLTKYAPSLAEIAIGSTEEETESKATMLMKLLEDIVSGAASDALSTTAGRPTPGQNAAPGKTELQKQYEAAEQAYIASPTPDNLRAKMMLYRKIKQNAQE